MEQASIVQKSFVCQREANVDAAAGFVGGGKDHLAVVGNNKDHRRTSASESIFNVEHGNGLGAEERYTNEMTLSR